MAGKITDSAGLAAISAWFHALCKAEAVAPGSRLPETTLTQHLDESLRDFSASRLSVPEEAFGSSPEGAIAPPPREATPQPPREVIATAVRYTLTQLERRAPGRSVEVRVPPFAAVQVIPGATHRRGTPPAVIEMSADTWLRLAVGVMSWEQALRQDLVRASGQRAELDEYLPLRLPGGER